MNTSRILWLAVAVTALGVCTLLTVATTSEAHPHHGEAEVVIDLADATMGKTYVAHVEGMTCPTGCAPRVAEALRTIHGVESVEVDFDKKQAVIRIAPGHTITQEACDDAFGNSGYFVDELDEVVATSPGA